MAILELSVKAGSKTDDDYFVEAVAFGSTPYENINVISCLLQLTNPKSYGMEIKYNYRSFENKTFN